MKFSAYYIAIMIGGVMILTSGGCRPSSAYGGVEKVAEAFSDTLYAPQYAKGFTILSNPSDSTQMLEVRNPWQGAKDEVRRVLLLNGSSALPSAGITGDTQVLPHVPKRIVCTSSTQVAMLEALGMTDRIVGVSGKKFLYSDSIKVHSDKIVDIGYDNQVDYEKLVGVRPDLVLLYGVGGPNIMESKLREIKIPYMYVGEYLEESPLGKAEWIVPLAFVLNHVMVGRMRFEDVRRRYDAIKERAKSGIGDEKSRPLVMLNTPYQDVWYMPPHNSYFVQLIEDAGGRYILSAYGSDRTTDNNPIQIDKENALLLCNEADVWLNPGGNFESFFQLKRALPPFATSRIFTTGRIYNNTLRTTPGGGNDFFEGGVMNPDKILDDLNRIFYPSEESRGYNYYKPLR